MCACVCTWTHTCACEKERGPTEKKWSSCKCTTSSVLQLHIIRGDGDAVAEWQTHSSLHSRPSSTCPAPQVLSQFHSCGLSIYSFGRDEEPKSCVLPLYTHYTTQGCERVNSAGQMLEGKGCFKQSTMQNTIQWQSSQQMTSVSCTVAGKAMLSFKQMMVVQREHQFGLFSKLDLCALGNGNWHSNGWDCSLCCNSSCFSSNTCCAHLWEASPICLQLILLLEHCFILVIFRLNQETKQEQKEDNTLLHYIYRQKRPWKMWTQRVHLKLCHTNGQHSFLPASFVPQLFTGQSW